MSNENPLDYLEALMNKGKRRPRVKFEYLKEGKQIFRILPSFDPTNRRIDASYSVHWLTGENGKTVKVQCTYYSEKFCPICNAQRETKELFENAKKSNPESEATKRLGEAVQKLGVSKSTYYNAVNGAGEAVVLELNSTVSKALEALIIKAYSDKNFDAVALNGGVWFEFEKSGKGRDSVRVDFKRISKMIEGDMVDVLDRTPLNEDLIARLPQSVANIQDAKTMYIRTYSSAELADYLRGKPLLNTNGQAQAQADNSSEETEGNEYQTQSASSSSSQATSTQTTANTQQSTSGSWQGGGSMEQTQTQSPSSQNLNQYSSHAERLKKLANPNG